MKTTFQEQNYDIMIRSFRRN